MVAVDELTRETALVFDVPHKCHRRRCGAATTLHAWTAFMPGEVCQNSTIRRSGYYASARRRATMVRSSPGAVSKSGAGMRRRLRTIGRGYRAGRGLSRVAQAVITCKCYRSLITRRA